ncbi:MAG: tRNA (adenosine(37)-N6)-threonylcarbamoyltransferase complex transferase subunit TsaD, partial [Gaiellales bacterium]
RYGGVVPEVASRRHLELIERVTRSALDEAEASLDDVDLVAVTQGPGLVGALLVGLAFAKALAWSRRRPCAPVDHLHGHVASLFIGDEPVEPPFVCLLASGGHTLILDVPDHGSYTVLGRSIDDAAGEAFDKGARLLGLGYPGGAALDRLARDGDPHAYAFPVARVPGADMSFSGVKTALYYEARDLDADVLRSRRADLAASYEHAIVSALVRRLEAAADAPGVTQLAVVGGVAANSELRRRLGDLGARLAPLDFCTDNGAMIASAARYVPAIPFPYYGGVDAYPSA